MLAADLRAAAQGRGPAVSSRAWPRELRAAFPGRQRRLEAWVGEGAAFARYGGPQGPLFLKYLPAGWADARAYRRLAREVAFLRDLAPHMPVPHAPLLHAGLDAARVKAHLLTRDLTDCTSGWGAFTTDEQRERALHDLLCLVARFHAFWDGQGRPRLTPEWTWDPAVMVQQAEALTARRPQHAPHRDAVADAARQLPDLLARAHRPTVVHGDLHSGQVLWGADGQGILIDYGQTHASIPGEDLAHVLAVRLAAPDRARLQAELLESYRDALGQAGLVLSAAEVQAQYRAGVAINLLSTARQAARTPGSGVQEALDSVATAWAEEH